MSLPILTTVEDIETVVGYLRNKPTGASAVEAKAVIKEALDPRKVAAYIFWELVTKEEDKLKLATRGWELARKSKSKEIILREVLDSVVPYRSALEWVHHQKFEQVTNTDIAAQWHEYHSDSLGSDNENSIKDMAVCFFRIAEAAGLGTLKIGRRGAPTRLEVNRKSLGEYVESGPTAPPLAESIEESPNSDAYKQVLNSTFTGDGKENSAEEKQYSSLLRVFITHGKNPDLVEQVETMLQVSEIEYEVAVKEESTAIPVPEKVFGAMRRCTAGLTIVSKEQTQADSSIIQINPNVLIEIGAAFVLYDRRVILLWEKGMPVPSNLQGLYRCEFEGNELGWAAGMKLLKAVKEFRK